MEVKGVRGPDVNGDFEQFWRAYPRRVAKGDARKAWRQMQAVLPPIAVVLQAVAAARASEQWRRNEGQFVPYPATWLRAERWDDEHEVDLATEAQARPWHETATGIEARGRELGVRAADHPHFQAFRAAVMRAHAAAEQARNVVPMRRAG